MCPLGEVPNRQKNGCDQCTGPTYAFEGDESCRRCFFSALILTGDENLCTPVYTVLFLFASILLAVFVLAIVGRLRVECLKRRLKKLVAARNWKDLHTTQARPLEYGLWQRRACKLLALRKAEVKSRSLQLGVSLDYVFSKLENIYKEKAQQAEWRVDVWGPTTRSGFFVRVRSSGDAVDPESAWPTLSICDHPEDPNFHQVAALLAYGPWALGKGLCCPRDGLADCSLVDALETECNSAKATWFLSWVWNYKFTTVVKARFFVGESHTVRAFTLMKNLQPQTGPGQNMFHFFIILVIIAFIMFYHFFNLHFLSFQASCCLFFLFLFFFSFFPFFHFFSFFHVFHFFCFFSHFFIICVFIFVFF